VVRTQRRRGGALEAATRLPVSDVTYYGEG
jgi:hypothetical protein